MKRPWAGIAAGGILTGVLVTAALLPAGAATVAGTPPAPDTITTFAGGVGGPDPATRVSMEPCGLRYADGALYVGSEGAVRRIDPATGWLTDVAGDGAFGPAADGVRATGAAITGACNLAVDAHGNDLLTEGGGISVVASHAGTFYGKTMRAGYIYPIASFLGAVVDVEPGADGTLLVTVDGFAENHTQAPGGAQIWAIAERGGTVYGQRMTAGHDYVLAGELAQTNTPNDGELATQAWLTPNIGNLRVDRAGNLVVADPGYQLVRVIAERAGTFYGLPMRAGRSYDIAGDWKVSGDSGNGVPATKALLYEANSLTLDSHGNVLIADGGQVRVVAEASGTFYGVSMRPGYIYTIAGTTEPEQARPAVYAGDGGPARTAVFDTVAVAVDGAGNVALTSDTGRVLLVAERSGTFYGIAMTAGDIYAIAGNGDHEQSGDGGAATSAEFNPDGVAYDRADGLTLIPDIGSGGTATARLRAVPSRSGTYFGRAMTAGDIYTIAGGVAPVARSGVPATDAGFSFTRGTQLAVTSAGNLVVAQYDLNVVQVVAARSGTFYGVSMKTGYVYTIAGTGKAGYAGDGGPAAAAELDDPASVAVDGNGNVLLADGPRVRVIAAKTGTFYGQQMTANHIYTIAGDGSYTYSGDGGPAAAAGMAPDEVAVDNAGNVLISDSANCRVRVVPPRSGTFYGVAMTAGDIYTIAGDASCGVEPGDGDPATAVSLSGNLETAVDSAGNVLLNDDEFVQLVAEKSGTFYGQKMTAGDMYAIAGTLALPNVFGDGGPATRAYLNVAGLAVTPAGTVLIADPIDFRIRSIAA